MQPWHIANAICIAILLSGLGGYCLLDPDESRSAEVSREMLERGDWITPTLNYVPYFEKPPLLYWLIAGGMKVFGCQEWVARAVPALFAVLGMAVAYWLASATVGVAAARWAPSVLATTLLFFALGRLPNMDMLFSVLLAAALTAWWSSRRDGTWRLLVLAGSGFLLGLAVLAKGPVAIVLFVGVAFVYLLWAGEFIAIFFAIGVPVVFACFVAAPWFLMVQADNPGFAHYFFVVQHFQRFTGDGLGEHPHGLLFYVPVLIAGFGFWSVLWPALIHKYARHWRNTTVAARANVGFLMLWFAVIVLFFSASSCKLMPYILPVWWPLAVATAAGVYALLNRARVALATRIAIQGTGLLLLLCLGGALYYIWHQNDAPLASLRLPALLLSLAWVAAAATFFAALRGRDGDMRFGLLACAAAVALLGIIPVFQAFASHRDVGPLLPEALNPPAADAGWALAQYRCYNQSFNFYTRSRVMLIDAVGEVRLGLNEPDAETWFRKGEETIDALSVQGPLALVTMNEYGKQVAEDHNLTVWAADRDRMLLLNDAGVKLAECTAVSGGVQ